MAKKAQQSMSTAHVRAVQERRRSNAAGTHSKPYNRSADKRRSIKEQD